MSYNRTIGQVSFNLNDAFEAKLHNHAAAQGVFSKYVKRLITRDIEGGGVTYAAAAPMPMVNEEEKEAMGSFL